MVANAMIVVKCPTHDQEYRLPTTQEEFLSGKFHDQVELCQAHIEVSPDCKFREKERCEYP